MIRCRYVCLCRVHLEEKQREEEEEQKKRKVEGRGGRKASGKTARRFRLWQLSRSMLTVLFLVIVLRSLTKQHLLVTEAVRNCPYYARLRKILYTQRVRYRYETAAAYEKYSRKVNKVMETDDARQFLSASGVNTDLFSQAKAVVKFDSFHLLKDGGLDAVDALAYQIVYCEEAAPAAIFSSSKKKTKLSRKNSKS